MAIYYLTRWMASSGKKVRLVELGPGRGTLMDDMLRVSQYVSKLYSLPVLAEYSRKTEYKEDREMADIDDSDIIRFSNNIKRNLVDSPSGE
jgi:SAM-dependent MidA family methyltransferase